MLQHSLFLWINENINGLIVKGYHRVTIFKTLLLVRVLLEWNVLFADMNFKSIIDFFFSSHFFHLFNLWYHLFNFSVFPERREYYRHFSRFSKTKKGRFFLNKMQWIINSPIIDPVFWEVFQQQVFSSIIILLYNLEALKKYCKKMYL